MSLTKASFVQSISQPLTFTTKLIIIINNNLNPLITLNSSSLKILFLLQLFSFHPFLSQHGFIGCLALHDSHGQGYEVETSGPHSLTPNSSSYTY